MYQELHQEFENAKDLIKFQEEHKEVITRFYLIRSLDKLDLREILREKRYK